MATTELRVGVVGVGGIARDQHLPAWKRLPFARVVAVADPCEQSLAQVADKFQVPHQFCEWQNLIGLDLDIVDICTPNRTHTAIATAALNSGKHVLCEKPLATTSEEVRAMQAAAARNNRVLMTAHNLRFKPASRQLKALIDGGMLGEVYYTRAQWLRRRLLPARATFTDKRLSGGGPVLDIGVHVLDLACWFLGSPEPVTVSAFVDTKLAHRNDLAGAWGEWDRKRFDVEDFAVGFVRFANGTTLLLETSWLSLMPEKELIRLQCFGTRGGLVWPDGVVCGETNRVPWDLRAADGGPDEAYAEEIRQFAVAVRDGMPSPVPVAETLNVIRILEAVYESGQLQREVTL